MADNLLADCAGKTLANGLCWLNEPPTWNVSDGVLAITPAAPSDFFRPYGGDANDNGCLLHKEVRGDFTAVARTRARLVDFGDAAALMVRACETQWAKICMERSPKGEISAVTVVTREFSDDCNSELLEKPECYLRLTRKGNVLGMHYSLDGAIWRFVRMFSFELPESVMVGILAQAPFTSGSEVDFSLFTILPGAVADFRSGE